MKSIFAKLNWPYFLAPLGPRYLLLVPNRDGTLAEHLRNLHLIWADLYISRRLLTLGLFEEKCFTVLTSAQRPEIYIWEYRHRLDTNKCMYPFKLVKSLKQKINMSSSIFYFLQHLDLHAHAHTNSLHHQTYKSSHFAFNIDLTSV